MKNCRLLQQSLSREATVNKVAESKKFCFAAFSANSAKKLVLRLERRQYILFCSHWRNHQEFSSGGVLKSGTCSTAWAHLKQRKGSWKNGSSEGGRTPGEGKTGLHGSGSAVIIHFLSAWSRGGEAAAVRPCRHPGPVNPHRHGKQSEGNHPQSHRAFSLRGGAGLPHPPTATLILEISRLINKLCEGKKSTQTKALSVFALFPQTNCRMTKNRREQEVWVIFSQTWMQSEFNDTHK